MRRRQLKQSVYSPRWPAVTTDKLVGEIAGLIAIPEHVEDHVADAAVAEHDALGSVDYVAQNSSPTFPLASDVSRLSGSVSERPSSI